MQQHDVAADRSVALHPDGDLVTGTTTLDLCNGTFPSESLRTARLQVLELDGTSATDLEYRGGAVQEHRRDDSKRSTSCGR